MLDLDEVRAFFDARAEKWDEISEADDVKIEELLDNLGVRENMRVLDVACGTGVLIPHYLRRKVESVTAIDLSPAMISVAKKKHSYGNVTFLTGDVMAAAFDGKFDAIMIYNAFPHFSEPERLIARLSDLLNDGGRLAVAHGASRKAIDAHHNSEARGVSMGLMEAEALASLFEKTLNVTTVLSDDRLYEVVGEKRQSS
ncbi:MAG: methyltransferase domain-containing protein [Lachnospiraceae bacterium]|nr:methyltransferase domain-containing protein [Lachnospiraceae bacterium]